MTQHHFDAAPTPQLDRLHRVDALKSTRGLPDRSVDLVFTDPPYASGGLHRSARERPPTKKYAFGKPAVACEDFDGDNMDQRAWAFWCHAWLSESRRALKHGGLFVCFIDWRQLATLTDVVQTAALILRGIAVWDKTPGRVRPRRGGFAQQAEFIVWASRGTLAQRDVSLPGVFQCRLDLPKRHLTEKPLALAREVVRLVPEGGLVCDPFAGAGTFVVAACEAGRHWLGCETNAAYYAVAVARLAEVQALAGKMI